MPISTCTLGWPLSRLCNEFKKQNKQIAWHLSLFNWHKKFSELQNTNPELFTLVVNFRF